MILAKIRKLVVYTFIVGILLLLMVVFVDGYVTKIGKQYIYSNTTEVPQKQVAIILGAGVWENGRVSHVLEDRLLTGIELYKQNKVKKLLLSGDHGQKNYDEVNAMRKFVESFDIPAEDVFLDHAGFSTYDSMYRARDVFEVKDAVIVTQDFHLPRAVYLSRQMGIEAVGISADRRPYLYVEYLEYREKLAKVKAFMQVMVNAKPKYLGPVIPITGDGRVSYDQL